MSLTLDQQIAAKDLAWNQYAYIQANRTNPTKYPLPYPEFVAADFEAVTGVASVWFGGNIGAQEE
jgi:hypothetical protein